MTPSIAPAVSTPTAPIASGPSRSFTAGAVLDHWHLLSLDAPTIAALWAFAFAHSMQVTLPWLSCAMLALATWLLYVADRLLDATQQANASALHERHHFHLRYRTALLAVALPACMLLAWFVAVRMDPAPRREDCILCLCALLYLVCVHLPLSEGRRGIPRLPKEAIVATIFAAACVIPAWSRQSSARPALFAPALLFALLSFLNCSGIEHWESPSNGNTTAGWIGRHFQPACLCLSISAVASGFLPRPFPGTNAAMASSIAASALLLLCLHRGRIRLDPLRLRALADAALLTPAIFLLLFARIPTA